MTQNSFIIASKIMYKNIKLEKDVKLLNKGLPNEIPFKAGRDEIF